MIVAAFCSYYDKHNGLHLSNPAVSDSFSPYFPRFQKNINCYKIVCAKKNYFYSIPLVY